MAIVPVSIQDRARPKYVKMICIVGLALPPAVPHSSVSLLLRCNEKSNQILPTTFPPNKDACSFPLCLADRIPLLPQEDIIAFLFPFLQNIRHHFGFSIKKNSCKSWKSFYFCTVRLDSSLRVWKCTLATCATPPNLISDTPFFHFVLVPGVFGTTRKHLQPGVTVLHWM